MCMYLSLLWHISDIVNFMRPIKVIFLFAILYGAYAVEVGTLSTHFKVVPTMSIE